MIAAKKPTQLLLALAVLAALLAIAPAAASAAPILRVGAYGNTAVKPGGELPIMMQLDNLGDEATSGDLKLEVQLPSGFTGVNVTGNPPEFPSTWSCPGIAGQSSFTCETSSALVPKITNIFTNTPRFLIAVSPSAPLGPQTSSFRLSGGEAPLAAETVEVTRVSEADPVFGIDALDAGAFDAAGEPFTQAGGHPDSASATVDFNTETNANPLVGPLWPVEATKDVFVDAPPGLLGDPTAAPECSFPDIAQESGWPICAPATQVGTVALRINGLGSSNLLYPIALFNLEPPTGIPARFGFNIAGTVITLTGRLRSDGDYGLSVDTRNASEGLAIAGSTVTLWGNPAAASHDGERGCTGKVQPAFGGPTCPAGLSEELPFLRNPTACTKPGEGLPTTAHADSWVDPGDFREATVYSHQNPGYPYPHGKPQGPEGCAKVPFNPSVSLAPTTNQADAPSGLDFELSVPQDCWQDVEAICQSDLRKAVVTLPEGMTVNPASADGLGACSSAEIGLKGTDFPMPAPIRFSEAPVQCPNSSKLGTVEIETPLLDHSVKGAVYLAKQQDNPFNSLLALYIAAEDPETGIVLKLAGHVEAQGDGQLVTTFDNQPQLPFEELRLHLFEGSRASLRTPASCGTHTARVELSPWSANPAVNLSSSFAISQGPGGNPCPDGGFDPKLAAGTQQPIAAAFSPFSLRLSREDGTRELTGVSATLPPGLLGKLAGIPYCPESSLSAVSEAEGSGAAQLASPSCPAASQLGTVTVGAGAGANPFYLSTGRAYLSGPYKGAPLSMAILTPAVAGPFDLGSVLVRTALRINPATAQITAVSDPLPLALHGIPLDLRDVRVEINRPAFTLNPTSCDPMAIQAQISGTGGATANRADRFQVAECASLPFKPKLGIRLRGATKRTAHPKLIATLKARPGDANIARAQVTLPRAAFLDQSHIKTVCTRVQFAADACPKGSIYGKAEARSPLVDYPLSGPVYLRSSDNTLPDLVVALKGPAHQPIEIDLSGRTDSFKGALRNTFELLPDAPVSSFRLELFGGKRGLVVNSRNLCAHPYRATVKLDGQNGKLDDSGPALRTDCAKKKRGKKGHR